MKKNLLCIWLVPLAILFSVNMHAQMTIGGKKEPEAFSVLELLNKGGLRLPQMTTAERDAFAVQGNDKGSGLTIYNKTTGCVEYWNKTRWVSLCDDTSVNALIAAENGLTAASGKVQLGGALLKPTTLTTTAANTLTIQGLQTGASTDNVLVADANGVLKWVTRAQFGGDNLGNHTATQDLVMSSKNITGAANVTASGTVTGANITATTKTTTPAAQITTGAGLGKVAVSDASGNVTWTDPATIAAKGDDLGNHTATTTLNMNKNIISNISKAYFIDQVPANTNAYGIYKDSGVLGIYNNAKSGNDLMINETTRRTWVNNLTIGLGTDGAAPAAGSIAVAADASGNVVWKPASSLAVTGDNLGNHTATQDLVMSSKNITGAANVTASGTVTGANITATTKTTTPAAQITTGAGLGKVAVSDASGNVTWTDPATIAAKGDNLGNHTATQDLVMSSKNITGAANVTASGTVTGANITATTKTTTPAAQITTGAGLGKVAVSDASGNLTWTDPATIAAKGDNLGNHTATTTLNMANNDISNIHGAVFKDRDASNENIFTLYKSNGGLGVWNGLKNGTDFIIDEATRKTGVNNLSIYRGTDGGIPAAGLVAVSADGSGNVIWKSASALGAGDNLGNHTATQDLVMSSKNITGAANVTASGTVTGANITATTKTTTPAAQITTGAGAGKVAVSDASGNLTWTDPATIAAKGDDLGNHTATQDLDMTNKSIKNIYNGYIKNELQVLDRTTTNTNYFGLYKSNGIFSIYNSKQGGNAVSIDEATSNVGIGTGGSTPISKLHIVGDMTLNKDFKVGGTASTAGNSGTDGQVLISKGSGAAPNWVNASTIGDNLGNHTATTTLNMNKNIINNINVAYFADQIAANTNAYGIFKNNGALGIYNNSKSGNDLTISEATRRTWVNNLAIGLGTDGAGPAAGSVAVAADVSGNVVWKSPASLGVPGDNLGNHTATQALTMGYNVVNFNKSDGGKLQFLNSADGARIEHAATYVLKNVTGFKGESPGQFSWSNYSGAGTTEAEVMRLGATGNLGIGTNTPVAKLHVKATVDPIKLEGLITSTTSTDVSLVVGADGVVRKAMSPPPSRASYATNVIAAGASETINLTISPDVSLFVVQAQNGCYAAFSTFTSTGSVLVFTGGAAAGKPYSSSGVDLAGTNLSLTVAGVGGCADGTGGDSFNFEIKKSGSAITITNKGTSPRAYVLRQSEF